MLDQEMVRTALMNVIDPEIGLDIVNLGLVYNIEVQEAGKRVAIDMTLTTPNCPAGPHIINQAREEVMALSDVYKNLEDVAINLVWVPFWNPSMMSDEAKDELGIY